MGHTKEPWVISEYGNIESDGRTVSAKGLALSSCETSVSNARRIVACVNACEGIPTDYLEMSPHMGLFHLAEFSNNVVQQRDELLAALKGIRDMIGFEWLRAEFNDARDAISKAEAA